MKFLIVGIIVLALSVAGVSTYLIRSFSGEENIEGLQKKATTKVKVLVAAREIRPGTGVTPDALDWQDWDKDSLNEMFIVAETDKEAETLIKDFIGGTARSVISQGEPILAAKIFKSGKSGVLAGMLGKGMRAVSFPVSSQTAVAGFILPGDRVDILLSHQIAWKKPDKSKEKGSAPPPGAGQELEAATSSKITETIMRNVTVLAINQAVDSVGEEGNNIAMPAKTVTLELTPKQAEILTTARIVGKLSMVLRSLRKSDDETEELTYTIDADISPFFAHYRALRKASMEGRAKDIMEDRAKALDERAKALQDRAKTLQDKEDERAMALQDRAKALQDKELAKAPAPKLLPKPTPAAKPKRVIRIFTGAGEPEEIQVK